MLSNPFLYENVAIVCQNSLNHRTVKALLTDTLVSALLNSVTITFKVIKPVSTTIQTLYLYIPLSGRGKFCGGYDLHHFLCFFFWTPKKKNSHMNLISNYHDINQLRIAKTYSAIVYYLFCPCTHPFQFEPLVAKVPKFQGISVYSLNM